MSVRRAVSMRKARHAFLIVLLAFLITSTAGLVLAQGTVYRSDWVWGIPRIQKVAEAFFAGSDVDVHLVVYAEVDIDDDGQKELIFTVTQKDFCGTAGCTSAILQKRGRKWVAICENSSDGEIHALDQKDGRYRRLILRHDHNGPVVTRWENGRCIDTREEELERIFRESQDIPFQRSPSP